MEHATAATSADTRKRKIECKPELVISSLQRFYATHPDIDKILAYLVGEAPLSLRIIDWFVTKYSRKHFVRYSLNQRVSRLSQLQRSAQGLLQTVL